MAAPIINIEVTTDTDYIYSFAFIKHKLSLYVSATDTIPTGLTASSPDSWINVKSSDTNLQQLVFELSENTSFAERQGTITVTARSNDTSKSIELTITQKGFEYHPIWKTTNYTYNTLNNNIEYEIVQNNETIYAGRAYKLPNHENISININELCSNSLTSEIDNAFYNGNTYQYTDAYKKFNLYVNDKVEDAYYFYNSYSYDELPINSDGIVNTSFPINNVLDTRQYFVNSYFRPNVINTSDYHTVRYVLRPNVGDIYSNTISDATNKQCVITDKNVNKEGVLTLYYNINTNNTMTYEVKNTCCKYCLYYINAYGGWDSFLINGNNSREDKYTSLNILKYVNNTTTNFELKPYLNEIDVNYTLYTHYLTDDEASRMYHLLESNTVYLHNLEEDKVIPVVITNKSCKFKTFTNEGKEKFYYTINVKESLKKIRK